jgi:hypothetical protein
MLTESNTVTVTRCKDFAMTGNYSVSVNGKSIAVIYRDPSNGYWYEDKFSTSPYPYVLGFNKAEAIADVVKRITADTL